MSLVLEAGILNHNAGRAISSEDSERGPTAGVSPWHSGTSPRPVFAFTQHSPVSSVFLFMAVSVSERPPPSPLTLTFIIYLFMYLCVGCGGQKTVVVGALLLCGSWGWNSGI